MILLEDVITALNPTGWKILPCTSVTLCRHWRMLLVVRHSTRSTRNANGHLLLENVQFRCSRRSEKAFNVHLPFQSLFEFLSSDVMRISHSDVPLHLAPAAPAAPPAVDYSALLKEIKPPKKQIVTSFSFCFLVFFNGAQTFTRYIKSDSCTESTQVGSSANQKMKRRSFFPQ